MSTLPSNLQLPTGWKMQKLGKVATLQRGFDLPVQDRQPGDVPIFAANGPVGFHDVSKVEGPGVVTGRSGSLGKVHFVESDYWPLNTALWVKDFHGNDPKWVYCLLTWMRLEQHTRGVGVPTLNRNLVHDVEIPLPPLEEQKRIAGILDHAAELCRLRTCALDKLNTLGQAIFHEMFGDPATNPFDWELTTLPELGRLDRGVSKHRPRNDPALLGGEHPLIQTGDVSRATDYITEHTSTYSDIGLAQSRKWNEGTVCITIAANIADTAILDFDACFPDSVVGFDSGSPATNFFVHRWFSTVKSRLEDIAPAVAQKNINLKILREIPVIKPPAELVEAFYAREQTIRSMRILDSRADARSRALFASLQHRAFRGKL